MFLPATCQSRSLGQQEVSERNTFSMVKRCQFTGFFEKSHPKGPRGHPSTGIQPSVISHISSQVFLRSPRFFWDDQYHQPSSTITPGPEDRAILRFCGISWDLLKSPGFPEPRRPIALVPLEMPRPGNPESPKDLTSQITK